MLNTNPTWEMLGFQGTDDFGREKPESYLLRICKTFPNIPKEVLLQWPYLHQRNPVFTKLYGWIDYSKVVFNLVRWPTKKILKIGVYSEFSQHAETYKKFLSERDLERISGARKIADFWQKNGSWEVPIIVLKTKDITIPQGINLEKPFHLVEGHTRLGWLMGFNDPSTPFKSADFHNLWLMEIK